MRLKTSGTRARVSLLGHNAARIDFRAHLGRETLETFPARYDQLRKKEEKKRKKIRVLDTYRYEWPFADHPGASPTKLHPEFQYSPYHISTLKRRQRCPGITLRLLCPCKPTLPTDYRDSDCGKLHADEARGNGGYAYIHIRTHTRSLSSQSFYQGGAAYVHVYMCVHVAGDIRWFSLGINDQKVTPD